MKLKLANLIGGLALFGMVATTANAATANTIGFTDANPLEVLLGETFSVHLEGANFTENMDAGEFSLSWDPAVITYSGINVSSPPWDTVVVNDTSATTGLLDYAFLGSSSGAGTSFDIAEVMFTAVGVGNSVLDVMDGPFNSGWLSGGEKVLPIEYMDGEVKVVPIPAAVWLFGSALIGFLGFSRRRNIS